MNTATQKQKKLLKTLHSFQFKHLPFKKLILENKITQLPKITFWPNISQFCSF